MSSVFVQAYDREVPPANTAASGVQWTQLSIRACELSRRTLKVSDEIVDGLTYALNDCTLSSLGRDVQIDNPCKGGTALVEYFINHCAHLFPDVSLLKRPSSTDTLECGDGNELHNLLASSGGGNSHTNVAKLIVCWFLVGCADKMPMWRGGGGGGSGTSASSTGGSAGASGSITSATSASTTGTPGGGAGASGSTTSATSASTTGTPGGGASASGSTTSATSASTSGTPGGSAGASGSATGGGTTSATPPATSVSTSGGSLGGAGASIPAMGTPTPGISVTAPAVPLPPPTATPTALHGTSVGLHAASAHATSVPPWLNEADWIKLTTLPSLLEEVKASTHTTLGELKSDLDSLKTDLGGLTGLKGLSAANVADKAQLDALVASSNDVKAHLEGLTGLKGLSAADVADKSQLDALVASSQANFLKLEADHTIFTNAQNDASKKLDDVLNNSNSLVASIATLTQLTCLQHIDPTVITDISTSTVELRLAVTDIQAYMKGGTAVKSIPDDVEDRMKGVVKAAVAELKLSMGASHTPSAAAGSAAAPPTMTMQSVVDSFTDLKTLISEDVVKQVKKTSTTTPLYDQIEQLATSIPAQFTRIDSKIAQSQGSTEALLTSHKTDLSQKMDELSAKTKTQEETLTKKLDAHSAEFTNQTTNYNALREEVSKIKETTDAGMKGILDAVTAGKSETDATIKSLLEVQSRNEALLNSMADALLDRQKLQDLEKDYSGLKIKHCDAVQNIAYKNSKLITPADFSDSEFIDFFSKSSLSGFTLSESDYLEPVKFDNFLAVHYVLCFFSGVAWLNYSAGHNVFGNRQYEECTKQRIMQTFCSERVINEFIKYLDCMADFKSYDGSMGHPEEFEEFFYGFSWVKSLCEEFGRGTNLFTDKPILRVVFFFAVVRRHSDPHEPIKLKDSLMYINRYFSLVEHPVNEDCWVSPPLFKNFLEWGDSIEKWQPVISKAVSKQLTVSQVMHAFGEFLHANAIITEEIIYSSPESSPGSSPSKQPGKSDGT